MERTNVDAAIDEVPDPAPRMIRPMTNMVAFWAAVMNKTPMSLRMMGMITPVQRPKRSTTGPIKVDTIAQPMKEAAALSDLVAAVSLSVSVYDGRMLMPFLQESATHTQSQERRYIHQGTVISRRLHNVQGQ